MPIRLVLVDDHPITLAGLDAICRQERDFEVIALCTSGADALHAVRAHEPDVVVLDLRMPSTSGLDVLRAIQREQCRTRVVLLTASVNEDEMLDAIRLGVSGVVLKEMAPQLLVQCIRAVHAGGRWLERRTAARALERAARREAATREVARILTPRETEITRMVASGLRNKDIANRLHVSEATVKTHVHNIFEKLGVTSRLELLTYARDSGLV